MTNRLNFLCALALLVLTYSCKKDNEDPQHESNDFVYHDVNPAEFPELGIEGFRFPEDSTVINQWIYTSQADKIATHGWGIWTGLTSKTNQYIPGDKSPLRVFETWLTPGEIVDSILSQPIQRSNRANLKRPNQLTHFVSNVETVNDSIHESVAYSPGAASFAINNKIFMATTLLDYAREGRTEVPFFPANAITIKPVFKVLQASSGETKFNISAWNGTTDELVAFPEQDWASFVTIDISRNASTEGRTFTLNDFIHYKLNDEDVYYFNKEFSENGGNPFDAKPGDIVILVGMHVGTREITNWTWQTFWWDANPDNPPLPSSKAIADQRPSELQGAARHYAMALAYYMVDPNEPYNGVDITGSPNYAFNPYLEAGFGPGVFNDSLSYIKTPSDSIIKTYVGVRTNCMSCHRMASINPSKLNTAETSNTPYVGNAFISRNDSIFRNQLLLDFAWSIQGNLDTTGVGAYLNKYGTPD